MQEEKKKTAEICNQVNKIEITSSKCNEANINIESINENKFSVDFQNQFDSCCSVRYQFSILSIIIIIIHIFILILSILSLQSYSLHYYYYCLLCKICRKKSFFLFRMGKVLESVEKKFALNAICIRFKIKQTRIWCFWGTRFRSRHTSVPMELKFLHNSS